MRSSQLRLAATAVLLVLAGFAAAPASAQEAIYLVRHAERLDDSDNPPLSPAGTARAQALKSLLRDAGITAVFATQYSRTIDTVKPLAAALGLPVVSVKAGDNVALVSQVKALGPPARVLIAGHSDTVPELLTAFGVPHTITIAKPEYDNLFVLVPGSTAQPVMLRLRY